ncbi:MAG: dynamin family protein [Gemmatimonadota bacterium]
MMDHSGSLERLQSLCAEFGIDPLRPQLSGAAEALRDQGVVDVAVLGAFKAGKSSFLNAVIGRDLMPVDVLPATAVVTRVARGPRDRVVVRRLSGAVEEVPPDRLAEFVTEGLNPGNEKRVALVDVELAALRDYEGVRFVDTPGLGSAFVHNTQAAMDWLPRVGGALLAVSVSHPLSGQDVALLRDVCRHTPEVAVLLTKADLVSDAQRDAVVEFLHRQVVRHTGRELPILPCSVLPGFAGLRDGVRDHLLRRIVARREEARAGIVAHKLRGAAAGCRQYLLLALAAADAAERARADLEEVVRREKGQAGAVAAEIGLLVRDLASRVRTASAERFHAYHGEVAARLGRELRARMPGWTGDFSKTTRAFREWLAAALAEELGRVSEHGETHLGGFPFKARASLQRTVRAFQDRLAGEIERALGIAFSGADFDSRIAPPGRPDVRVGRTFDMHVDLLWFVIPMAVVRPLVRRHFLKLVPWEVEKNLSRLSGQWADAVNASIEAVARQAVAFIGNELSTIERLVSEGSDRRARIRNALAELDLLAAGLDGTVPGSDML